MSPTSVPHLQRLRVRDQERLRVGEGGFSLVHTAPGRAPQKGKAGMSGRVLKLRQQERGRMRQRGGLPCRPQQPGPGERPEGVRDEQ